MGLLHRLLKSSKHKKGEKDYVCCWCNFPFKATPKYIIGHTSYSSKGRHGTRGKKGSGSNQITCPNCGGFIPTWKKTRRKNVFSWQKQWEHEDRI